LKLQQLKKFLKERKKLLKKKYLKRFQENQKDVSIDGKQYKGKDDSPK
tara:strand:- start:211 stop:354 length:144 start_codon:yes stop_codon:yes gene_type:complete